MSISPNGNDVPGNALNANLTALKAANNTDPQSIAANATAIAKAQAELVTHLVRSGRVQASSILSALSLTAASLPNLPKYGAHGSNISARITTLTTAVAGGQPYGASTVTATQQLKAAYEELLNECFNASVTTPAAVLALTI